MSALENGGSAFPCLPPQDTAAGVAVGYPYPEAGMSLRDYFAAKAMVGLMGRDWSHLKGDGEATINTWAASAYGIADAMLKARES